MKTYENQPKSIPSRSNAQHVGQRKPGVQAALKMPSTPVVQRRNKHWKRFLNVVTLGIRKAYVNHKRAAAQQPAFPIHPNVNDPEPSPLDAFVDAYGKSRFYHHTNPDNLPSIEKHGLLNHKDRIANSQVGDIAGMSNLSREYEGDEKKGVFLGPKHFMKENKATGMTKDVARAYLGADRTKLHHWTDEDVPSGELVRDEKFRGGAVITKDSIPPEQVTAQNISDLLEDDHPKLDSILDAVGSHFQGEAPSKAEMKNLLREAIRARRLSNAAFDDSET